MKNTGFTLIELLIVVAIIGIIATIAVPAYLGVQRRSERASVAADCEALRTEIDSMLKAIYAASPSMVKGTVDWNGDGTINSLDVTPGTNAQAIVDAVTSSNYKSRPKNPFGRGNAFDKGYIKLIPGNQKIMIKGYTKNGTLIYSEVAMAY